MTAVTTFRIPLDDETMAAVLDQAESTGIPPRELIAAVVRDVFLEMKREGVLFVRAEMAKNSPSSSTH